MAQQLKALDTKFGDSSSILGSLYKSSFDLRVHVTACVGTDTTRTINKCNTNFKIKKIYFGSWFLRLWSAVCGHEVSDRESYQAREAEKRFSVCKRQRETRGGGRGKAVLPGPYFFHPCPTSCFPLLPDSASA